MLVPRILSALILAPLALAAVWAGGWAFALLAALCGALMAWEWCRLCLGHFGPAGVVLGLMAIAVALGGGSRPEAGLAVIAAAAVAAPLAQRAAGRSMAWMAAGAFYLGLPELALVWLRGQGREPLFWVLLVVWATDIGAYVAGRAIGGPKLLPSVSPKKTWAGLFGGMVCAAAAGAGVAAYAGASGILLAGMSAALAVVAQAGDLAESSVKRYFGVKDSSGLIPGHGGVLDRLDGLLAAAPVVAVIYLAMHSGLEYWR